MDGYDEFIFLLTDSGGLQKVPVMPYDSEDLLQSLIEKHPDLLAGERINPDEPVRWILVKREAGVAGGEQEGNRWSIDHLLLDQNGIPTFVETKRSSDTRIRREIVGQMLDYAANAQKRWPIGHIRSMAAANYGGPETAEAAIAGLLKLEDGGNTADTMEAYWARVEDNLKHGHVRMLFVADRIPAELRRIIEFLNEQMDGAEVLGIELAQYVGPNLRALVPRVIGQTEAIRQGKNQSGPRKRHLTQQEFLENCPEETRDFFADAISMSLERGMQTYWGTTGFSLRAQDSTGALVTLFYGFPCGGSRQELAMVQGFVSGLVDPEYREQVRERFLRIPGTSRSGQYTVILDLTADFIDRAWLLMEEVWKVAEELPKINNSDLPADGEKPSLQDSVRVCHAVVQAFPGQHMDGMNAQEDAGPGFHI